MRRYKLEQDIEADLAQERQQVQLRQARQRAYRAALARRHEVEAAWQGALTRACRRAE